MKTRRRTMAQAVIEFLQSQFVERDGIEHKFFQGIWGIFGHGNVAGIGQALEECGRGLRYYQPRNEQAMVHAAAAFAKAKNRLQTFACTSSIGPGATNMLTAAAAATINRIPVLLLPGDIFSSRRVAPVLQQLEHASSPDLSVNDCFKPVSRYWDRINRPEQIIQSLPAAMRILADPAETGTATLCLPQDVQAEAFDYPELFFEKCVHHIPRPQPEELLLQKASAWIQASKRPMLVAGGGVIYSEATEALAAFARATGIPVAETQAGKGSLPWDDPANLGAMGVTGSPAANWTARECDLVIVAGSRLSDFTTASKTAWPDPAVRFININVASFDAGKHAALPLVGDARVCLTMLAQRLQAAGYQTSPAYRAEIASLRENWRREVDRLFESRNQPLLSQAEVIGIVNEFSGPRDVVVCAAGGLPGDLHKLWRTRQPGGYHLEYGYSCMGYEIAGGLGVKMAGPEREVYVLVGDGSYLMMNHEIITSLQEDFKLTILVLDNHGFQCIDNLSRACGSLGFGNKFRYRDPLSGKLAGENLKIDYALNAKSLGAHALAAHDRASLQQALQAAKAADKTTVIALEVDGNCGVPGYHSWWDVPVAAVSEMPTVQAARQEYAKRREEENDYLNFARDSRS